MSKIIIAALASVVIVSGCTQAAPPTPAPAEHEHERVIYRDAPVPQETPAQANTNAYVVTLQHALASKGYYHGRSDGRCGPQTRAAVAHYQHDLGVAPTAGCHVDPAAWSGLGLSPGNGNNDQHSDGNGPHVRKLELK